MANPSAGQLVANAWAKVCTELQPYHHVVLMLKDGRAFYFQEHYLPETMVHSVEYRTRTQWGHFDMIAATLNETIVVYVQRRGRSEPRFSVVPSYWKPYDPAAPLPELPKPYDPKSIFESPSIFAALKTQEPK